MVLTDSVAGPTKDEQGENAKAAVAWELMQGDWVDAGSGEIQPQVWGNPGAHRAKEYPIRRLGSQKRHD